MHNYASLQETQDLEEQAIPHHHVSEPTRSRWSHIENLDAFFFRVYKYHQKHGFTCIFLKEFVKLHQFVFVSGLTFTLLYAVDYKTMFSEKTEKDKHPSVVDVFLPFNKVMSNLSMFGWFLLGFLGFLFMLSFFKRFYNIISYYDIKLFYNQALGIPDDELDNATWHDVQIKLKEVQLDLQMCIHKRELTELDIYHRILRQTNYIAALVNKRLLPPRVEIPFLGELVYWTKGIRFNMMFLFFWSPWSPFENPWHLREEYKRLNQREKLARQLRIQVLWLFAINVLASPLVFMGQLIFYFFSYFDIVRREPGSFGVRYWSQYARLYLRHFNELDHELHSRLTRAYKPATKYMASFSSPCGIVVCQHITFICSSILAVFLSVSFLDNEFLYWDQVLTILAVLTGVITICRSLIPDEAQLWDPETLLEAVVSQSQYFPCDWKGKAHTLPVRTLFQQLFQYRFAALLEEFASPILTPYFLIRYIYPRSLDFVDFFRNFTVSVVGVGDVCSFAQMNIRKHGNPDWHEDEDEIIAQIPQYDQAEDGKVELSLVHFTTTNPEWEAPPELQEYVNIVNLETSKLDRRSMAVLTGSSGFDFNSMPSFHMANRSSDNIYTSAPQRKSMFNWKAEGPDLFKSAEDMRASTLVLHNRRALKRASSRGSSLLYDTGPVDRLRTIHWAPQVRTESEQVHENTPLLPNKT